MEQLSRILNILTLLRSKRLVTATEMANKYDVSVRTIYRDIKKLEKSGVPILTIEGKGYSLMDGYYVAPVQFTENEANALITAENLVKQSNDSSFAKYFEEAFIKIKSVFRDSIQEKSEILDSKIHVFNFKDEKVYSNALSEIQMAILNLYLVEIKYQKANATTVSIRKIEPYALYSTENKWILIAWCHLRNEYRSFRMDRIQNYTISTTVFEDRKFDLKHYFREDKYRQEHDSKFKN